MRAPPTTVIFDFDGTLADTLAATLRVCNRIAPEFGVRTVGEEEVDGFREMSIEEGLRRLGIPLLKLPVLVRRVRSEMRAEIDSVKLFDGMKECLQRLDAAGIRLGVVTSNSRQNVRACLLKQGVDRHIDFIHTAINLFGKHRTLRRLMRKRAILPEGVFYVGDQVRDVVAARRCKLRSIAAAWGYQSKARLLEQEPAFVADTPGDIARIVLGG